MLNSVDPMEKDFGSGYIILCGDDHFPLAMKCSLRKKKHRVAIGLDIIIQNNLAIFTCLDTRCPREKPLYPTKSSRLKHSYTQ